MNAKIMSPSGTVTVGPKRKLTVTIEAWGVILKGGGIGKGKDRPGLPGGDRPLPHPKGGGNLPGKDRDIQILNTVREIEAGKVEVKMGAKGSFKPATKLRSRGIAKRWRFTGTVPGTGELQISVRAGVGDAHQGNVAKRRRTVKVIMDDTPPKIKIISPERGDEVPEKGPDYTVTVKGMASDDRSGVKNVFLGIGEASKRVTVRKNGKWRKKLTLRGTGKHKIVVRAVDKKGNEKTRARTVTTVDNVGPDITINAPETDEVISWEEDKTIKVTGTAIDETSGVKSVQCKIDGDDFGSAELDPIDNSKREVRWSAEFGIPEVGSSKITVRAEDEAGNRETVERMLEVAVPQDRIALGTTRSDYLKDLLLFAEHRVRTGSDEAVDEELLIETFHQPFGRLKKRDVVKQATREISQIRIAVEVLRGFLDEQAEAIDSGYPEAAYHALLRQLGTSYEEIRMTRSGEEESRRALAERMGINDDKLDRLFIPPEKLTEARIEQIFGLLDTRRDPLAPPPEGRGRLLTWRRQHLRTRWKEDDRVMERPVIDPDQVGKPDIANLVEGNSAFDLLEERQTWVDDQLKKIRDAREGISEPEEAFLTLIGEFLDTNLEGLADQYDKGVDIQEQLDELKLDLEAFLHLLHMQALTEEEEIRDSEWKEVEAILLQVVKRKKYPEWQEEEKKKGVVLSPDDFKLRDENASDIQLPRWRASREARRSWVGTLETRIRQTGAIERRLQNAVEKVEQSTLPILRDALIAKAVEKHEGIDTNWLTQRLAIDVSSQSKQKTTRIRQAIETLQSTLFSVRASRFGTLEPVPNEETLTHWQILDRDTDGQGDFYNEHHFDEEWKWIGTYGKWCSAMKVFLHPENYLLPSLLERPDKVSSRSVVANIVDSEIPSLEKKSSQDMKSTGGEENMRFWNFLDDLRKESPLTRPKAYEIVKNYFGDYSGVPLSQEELLELQKVQEKKFEDLTDPSGIEDDSKQKLFFVPIQVALQLQKSGEYLAALDWFRIVYAYDLKRGKRKIYYGLVLEEDLELKTQRTLTWLLDGLNPHRIVNVSSRRPNAYTRFTLLSLVRCLLDFADSEFARESAESIPHARDLYITALEQLDHPALQLPKNDKDNPFPPNNLPVSLRQHAETNLHKLRQGQNIAGMQLPTTFEAGTLDPELRQATSYRYPVLIERAKQLVSIAQQVEANYLSALEKRDGEAYTLLQAEQDVELTKATVELQDLRIEEAKSNLELAGFQQEKAMIRSETYGEWIDEGLIKKEKSALALMGTSAALSVASSIASAAAAGQGFWKSAVTLGIAGNAASEVASSLGSLASASSTTANMLSTWASYERREQQWELQKGLAEQDIEIGGQQVAVSRDHLEVVGQEREIAAIQVGHAETSVQFLANKFTNADLYDWMSSVLSRVYAYFLQQAASTARLAQRQLTFQRQVKQPSVIQADYWHTFEQTTGFNRNGEGSDRRGLTGSARLLEDIYRLDQHAFETRKRKLELSQTFSLARLVPYEFQKFRETGTLLFETPMELFDRAFPGHHLRMIKRLSVSVVALVPPADGIKASLSASGLSRVVTGAPNFETSVIRHYPERIAFTSPTNATGILELQPNKEELLFPFEDMGVDTSWELEMPKPANSLDYRTVSDVLITVEYTALYSERYRQQLISQLGRSVAEDRTFSFRNQYSDQWYDLHNPEQTDAPMVVQFDTRRQDFPPNLSALEIQQIMVYFVCTDESSFEFDVEHFHLIADKTTTKGGNARTIEGIISTRRANGTGWMPLVGKPPIGTWELALPNTPKMKDHFRNEEIEDILFVISFKGKAPPWPK